MKSFVQIGISSSRFNYVVIFGLRDIVLNDSLLLVLILDIIALKSQNLIPNFDLKKQTIIDDNLHGNL